MEFSALSRAELRNFPVRYLGNPNLLLCTSDRYLFPILIAGRLAWDSRTSTPLILHHCSIELCYVKLDNTYLTLEHQQFTNTKIPPSISSLESQELPLPT